MAKCFLTYEQQIDKLINEKGLLIADREYAENVPKRTSYYSLIRRADEKGDNIVAECFFQYDRLYLNAAYHEPEKHRHLLSHIISMNLKLREYALIPMFCIQLTRKRGSCSSACSIKLLYLPMNFPIVI
ncbi:MAG: hypothetical protein LUH20_13235 [Lachnospiraceae bacterium]|nr:hypothetical protein [Lachnospiraceae bacterium]